MHATHIELLRNMPIFGALRDDTLEFLLGLARQVTVRAGDWFFREGDAATGLFVLEQGRASVFKGWGGQQVLLHHVHEGDCFGEMALMDLMPRSASVFAESDCHALQLDSADLYQLSERDIEQFALIQMNLGREVSRRLREADERLFHLQQSRAD